MRKCTNGQDRLGTPLMRMKDGKYDKDGEFAPVSWDQAFDEMAAQFKRVLKDKGRPRSACSVQASGLSGKVMRPSS
jgi:nitrate reductase NapA